MYVDRLMNLGLAHDWGICGVGVMAADIQMRDVLTTQDCLYTLMVKHADGRLDARIIGSIVRYLYAPDDPEAVIETLVLPSTRIVSLTVTEGGYNVNPVTGEFDRHNAAVRADIESGMAPRTVFGLVIEALRRRRARHIPPFTVMSCDNLQENGTVTRKAFTAFAHLINPGLGEWVRQEVAFPNSMVDRITPVTSDSDRAVLLEHFGVDDRWPVVSEEFTQWVLEDDFPTGRPPLEQAAVQLVSDVEPYELMKLRLLNASHQALCYAGYLAGYRFVHEVATDPVFVEFVQGYMDDEATPTLKDVAGIDLTAYKANLIERFANAEVRDTLARVCAESSDKIPKWLLPVIRHNLASGNEIRRSATVVASWARYAEGFDEQGEPITIVDPLRDDLMRRAQEERTLPLAFLCDQRLFGDLADQARFTDAYLEALTSLRENGARKTVEALNEQLRR
jgi:mannitol 2-dehydrogenase